MQQKARANLVKLQGVKAQIMQSLIAATDQPAREFFQTQLGQQIAPMMVNMQKSLTLAANQLFSNDEQALPLRVRQAGDEEERER